MADSKTKRFYCPRHWTLAERLAHYTAPPNERGCRLWMGRRDRYGYGTLQWLGKERRAHRLAWTVANGPIPDGMHVCHKCDVRACRTEDHLFLGTGADNAADMTAKDRQAKGAAIGNAKLTEAAVLAIRASTRLQREDAVTYGVGRQIISQIRRRKSWVHITWKMRLPNLRRRAAKNGGPGE